MGYDWDVVLIQWRLHVFIIVISCEMMTMTSLFLWPQSQKPEKNISAFFKNLLPSNKIWIISSGSKQVKISSLLTKFTFLSFLYFNYSKGEYMTAYTQKPINPTPESLDYFCCSSVYNIPITAQCLVQYHFLWDLAHQYWCLWSLKYLIQGWVRQRGVTSTCIGPLVTK